MVALFKRVVGGLRLFALVAVGMGSSQTAHAYSIASYLSYDTNSFVLSGYSSTEKDLGRRALQPRGGRLDVLATSPDNDPMPALLQVLAAHAAGGGVGQFRASRSVGMIHVVSVRTRDANGDWIDDHPLLDTPLTVGPQSINGVQALQTICSSIADATGRTVMIGTIPGNLFAQRTVELEAKGEPARSVLFNVTRHVDQRLSWRLLSDGNGSSALNIHIVSSPKL
jgi:hypothetical protein